MKCSGAVVVRGQACTVARAECSLHQDSLLVWQVLRAASQSVMMTEAHDVHGNELSQSMRSSGAVVARDQGCTLVQARAWVADL